MLVQYDTYDIRSHRGHQPWPQDNGRLIEAGLTQVGAVNRLGEISDFLRVQHSLEGGGFVLYVTTEDGRQFTYRVHKGTPRITTDAGVLHWLALIEPPSHVTELDVIRADADQLAEAHPDYLDPEAWSEEQEDYAYWAEVMSCCKGTVWGCQHFRYYAELDDRFTHRED